VGLANHIQIENVFLPPARGSYTFRRAKEGFLAADVAHHEIISGQKIEIGGGALIEPIGCGDSGITFLVTYDNARILIPAGLATEQIEDLLTDQRLHDVSVMLLHDGGHPSANPRQWLLATNPAVVLLSVSSTAGVDRPSEEVLAKLQGRVILSTDQHGSIVLHTNGEELWVETERVSTR
jgi:beta-lactamase superfamily II metal-dependent hydrolase